THTRANVALQMGTLTAVALPVDLAKKRAGADQVARAIDLYDSLLRVNPKAFPYLLQKFQALRGLAGIRRQWNEAEEAERLNATADRLLEGMVRDNPNLDWVLALDVRRQFELLIGRVRKGEPFAFETEADKLIAVARPQDKDAMKYDKACAYSVASEKWPTDREQHAAKAVAILNDLIKTDFFKVPRNVTHLDKDEDLNSLRNRDDFPAFMAAVKKAAAAPPGGR
ncbi:MAG: hypothetical protein ABGY75_00615, partial [Gemmataceae bacterium]